jgi:hypothetical protein
MSARLVFAGFRVKVVVEELPKVVSISGGVLPPSALQ